jgi:hypothetical protein
MKSLLRPAVAAALGAGALALLAGRLHFIQLDNGATVSTVGKRSLSPEFRPAHSVFQRIPGMR